MRLQITDMKEEDVLWKEMLSTHFNIHYNRSRHQEALVKILLAICGQDAQKEVRCVVTNLYRMVKTKASCMKMSRAKDCYASNTQGISYSRSMRVVDKLESEGMINLYIGGVVSYSFDNIAEEFKMSMVEPTDKLLSLIVESKAPVSTEFVTTVQIKDRETKKILETQGVKGVTLIKEKVGQFNTALIESRISLKGIELPDQSYKRVFIDNLNTGGRWYNTVGGVQTMDKNLRPFLQIDGQDLQELDFSAIHPNICYQLINADLPPDFDPYGVDLWEDHVDAEAVAQFKIRHGIVDYNPSRNLIKMAVMIGLNCVDIKQAKRALSQHFGRDKSKWGKESEHKARYFGLYEVDFGDVLVKVQEHNAMIGDCFFSDMGVKLQFIDSEILEDVICATLAIDEVLLPWHDGVMVKKQIAEQVKGFMFKAWFKQFGSIRFCKVDKK